MPDESSAEEGVTPDDVRALAAAMGCRTQADLAERLGVTQARVSQILSGAYPVKPGALMQLIRALQAAHGQASNPAERSSDAIERKRGRQTRRRRR